MWPIQYVKLFKASNYINFFNKIYTNIQIKNGDFPVCFYIFILIFQAILSGNNPVTGDWGRRETVKVARSPTTSPPQWMVTWRGARRDPTYLPYPPQWMVTRGREGGREAAEKGRGYRSKRRRTGIGDKVKEDTASDPRAEGGGMGEADGGSQQGGGGC